MQERLSHQQKYIELLQAEKKEALARASRVKGQKEKVISCSMS